MRYQVRVLGDLRVIFVAASLPLEYSVFGRGSPPWWSHSVLMGNRG
jgi:hypothetical protein